ncbi:MAG: type II toxin-antitoxin system VapC family toxin [Nitrososphaerales archaeon]
MDANVVIKVVVDEDYSSEARMLFADYGNGKFNIYAPRILIFEVGSALYKLVKLNLISKEYSLNVLGKLSVIPFAFIDLDSEELVKTLARSLEARTSFYDAIYITVSQKTNSMLVTADEDMVKKARTYTKIMHVVNYKK